MERRPRTDLVHGLDLGEGVGRESEAWLRGKGKEGGGELDVVREGERKVELISTLSPFLPQAATLLQIHLVDLYPPNCLISFI